MTASKRLTELGLELPLVAKPAGSYVPALRVGDLVFTSGQLPSVHGELQATGTVGPTNAQSSNDFVGASVEEAADCARVCVLNALAAAAQAAGGIDNIARVVKMTVFVASAPQFHEQAVVANGASGLLIDIFGDAGRHTRSAVGVASLPLNAPVEIELIVQVEP